MRSRLARQPPGRPQTPRRPPRGHRRTGPGRHPQPSQDHLLDHAAPARPSPTARTNAYFRSDSPAQTSPGPATSPAPSQTWSATSGYLLLEWIRQAEQHAPKPIKGFAGFLRQDLDAVTAGLTLPWSSGAVEGHVNSVKTIKRAMYGRAAFALLRTRILTQP
ncbi:transposase [Streptomyces sp. NPDC014006]|uniref:transposase n=1 Tax=Streptomyces sp. NPDC014006 TaxID=3364870 RepID=UPI0036F60426